MDAVQRFFSGTILHLRHASDDPAGEDDQTEIAQAIAHYYLCMKRKAMHAHYFLPFTSEKSDLDGLLREWGFDVERNNADF